MEALDEVVTKSILHKLSMIAWVVNDRKEKAEMEDNFTKQVDTFGVQLDAVAKTLDNIIKDLDSAMAP